MGDRVAVLFLATLIGCWSAAGRAGELPDRKLTPGTVNSAISEDQYRALLQSVVDVARAGTSAEAQRRQMRACVFIIMTGNWRSAKCGTGG